MLQYSPLWGYDLASTIRPLTVLVRPGRRVADPELVQHLQAADKTLKAAFQYEESTAGLFPTATNSAVKLLVGICQLLSASGGDAAFNMTAISPADANHFAMLVRDFERDLERDASGWRVRILQDQGHYSIRLLLDNPDELFPKQLWESLPRLTRDEISCAAKCLAFECYTACGFHALRAVEALIREYVTRASGDLPKKRDWGHYREVLTRVGAADNVTSMVDDLRRHDRNPLMHPEVVLGTPHEAADVLILCKTVINRMATDMERCLEGKRASRTNPDTAL